MKPSELVGKIIKHAKFLGMKGYDDEPYLVLEFTDGTTATVRGSYGGYSGKSEDEYPAFIGIIGGEPENTRPVNSGGST